MTADLHALLDSLTGGERVKATWTDGEYTTTHEGPVRVDGPHRSCFRVIRWDDGEIHETLISIEAPTLAEEITVTRDDEAAMHALIDSLKDGQEVTAEWRNGGSMTLTGVVMSHGRYSWVCGIVSFSLRGSDGRLHPALHSVTVRHTVTRRWERSVLTEVNA